MLAFFHHSFHPVLWGQFHQGKIESFVDLGIEIDPT